MLCDASCNPSMQASVSGQNQTSLQGQEACPNAVSGEFSAKLKLPFTLLPFERREQKVSDSQQNFLDAHSPG
jgi:hypothetical protein